MSAPRGLGRYADASLGVLVALIVVVLGVGVLAGWLIVSVMSWAS